MNLAQMTKSLRHLIVRIVAPQIYREGRWNPRPMTLFMKEHFGKRPLIGAEIGVLDGENAISIFSVLNVEKLFLIDPYLPSAEYPNIEEHKQKAIKNLGKFGNRAVFVFKKSEDAVDHVPEGLDFIYIDGCHDYDYVEADINDYFPKIRDGGIIGGHDFYAKFPGVCKAVIEFSEANELEVLGRKVDWWIIKH